MPTLNYWEGKGRAAAVGAKGFPWTSHRTCAFFMDAEERVAATLDHPREYRKRWFADRKVGRDA